MNIIGNEAVKTRGERDLGCWLAFLFLRAVVQVAYLEPVTALLCLGLPLVSVDGKRGEPDDFLLDLRAPTLFVVGQNSATCTVDGVEQLRHRMKVPRGLPISSQ